MTSTGIETPRLTIEQTARRAIEGIRKERAQHIARLEQLDREQDQMVHVLDALGTTFDFEVEDKV